MMMRCMTPGCSNVVVTPDVLCPDCRQQSDNSRVSAGYFPLFQECAEFAPQPDLSEDLAKIAGWLVNDQNQQQAVIRRQQTHLDLREKIIRKTMRQRDVALDQATAERARADGLEDQVTGLRIQASALQAELDQLVDLASTNGRKPGLATIDTAPGDYSPEYLGYNRLWTRVDLATGREVLWRWYQIDGSGGY